MIIFNQKLKPKLFYFFIKASVKKTVSTKLQRQTNNLFKKIVFAENYAKMRKVSIFFCLNLIREKILNLCEKSENFAKKCAKISQKNGR